MDDILKKLNDNNHVLTNLYEKATNANTNEYEYNNQSHNNSFDYYEDSDNNQSKNGNLPTSESVSSLLDDDSIPVGVTIAEKRKRRDGSLELVQRTMSLDDLAKEVRGNNVYSDKSKLWKLKRKARKSNPNLNQLALEKSPSKISISIQPATPTGPTVEKSTSSDNGGLFTFEPPSPIKEPKPQALSKVTTESLRDLLNPKAHESDVKEEINEISNKSDDDIVDEYDDNDSDANSNYSSDSAHSGTTLDHTLQRNPKAFGFGEFREHRTEDVIVDDEHPNNHRNRSHSIPTSNTHELKTFERRKPVEMEVFRNSKQHDEDNYATELNELSKVADKLKLPPDQPFNFNDSDDIILNDPRYVGLLSLKSRVDGFREDLAKEIEKLSQK